MPFSWSSHPRPILALAPMAGYTDSAFRQIVKSIAPSTICVTELTSADGLKFGGARTKELLKFNKTERPLIVQLFGKKVPFFIEAGKIVEQEGADGIDINMGCPARKVIASEHGSALIKKPELAAEIVYELTKITKLPISVKTRIGFETYDEEHFLSFIKKLEEAGASSLTIHGRTTKQGFSGKANWDPIYLAKEHLKIPVIGNGDITSPQIAVNRLKDLDGIMVGRATFGNPWIMQEIESALQNPKNIQTTTNQEQDLIKIFQSKLPLIYKHLHLAAQTKGRKGLLEMRKHLAIYIKGLPEARSLREKLVRIESEEEGKKILESIKNN